MAVPWRAVDDALAQAGALRGKTVITCMLLMTDDEQLAIGFTTSGAGRWRAWAVVHPPTALPKQR
jgi:predicted dinucleotide-binding enzyme